MDCVYRTSDRALAQLLCSALSSHEIQAIVEGEHLSSLQGLAVPAGSSAEYRVCIIDSEQMPQAERFVRDWLRRHSAPDESEPWSCASCGESHGGQFSSCWRCGAEESP